MVADWTSAAPAAPAAPWSPRPVDVMAGDAGAAAPPSSSATTTGALIRALNHPIRREILRFLFKKEEAGSGEIEHGISPFIGWSINFHFDILVEAGAVVKRKRSGYRESFYAPTPALETPWFKTVLI